MKDLTGKRGLGTGGAGSSGSCLCTWLVNTGHDVLTVDNDFTGRRSNRKHLSSNARFESIRHAWAPKIGWDEGLARTVPYFEDDLRWHKT